MKYEVIKDMLEKYWQGESSLEEEAQLSDYFNNQKVHPDFESYRSLFVYYAEQKKQVPGDNFDEKILKQIKQTQEKTKQPLIKKLNNIWIKAAAVALLLIGGWQVFQHFNSSSSPISALPASSAQIAMTDTYKNPQQAMEEVQKALLIMSRNMNHGEKITKEKLSNLNALNKVME